MTVEESQNTVLCFGKYNGKTIQQVYDEGNYDYLKYMSENAFFTKSVLKNKCQDAIKIFVECKEELFKPYRETFKEYMLVTFKPLLDCLKYYQLRRGLKGVQPSYFMLNMQSYIEKGTLPPLGAREYIVDTAAKTKGRRNSIAYKEAVAQFNQLLENAVQHEKNLLDSIKTL